MNTGHMLAASCVPLPVLIRLMITEGQSECDPCPNIKQINTTLITKMWTHLQSPLIKESCFDWLCFHFPPFVLSLEKQQHQSPFNELIMHGWLTKKGTRK